MRNGSRNLDQVSFIAWVAGWLDVRIRWPNDPMDSGVASSYKPFGVVSAGNGK